MKRVFLVVLLVSLMASLANASWYWEGDVDQYWSNWENWNDGSVSPPASDHGDTERINIPQGTVTADESDTMGYLHDVAHRCRSAHRGECHCDAKRQCRYVERINGKQRAGQRGL